MHYRPAQVVLATGNAGKLREIQKLFDETGIQITAQSEFNIESPPETGETFVDNALLKARHAAKISGLPALGDDSGLAVDALQGRPGVRSARYAGEAATDAQNIDRLLHDMDAVPDAERTAGFHCAAVLVFPDTDIEALIVEAAWRGRILRQRQGEDGFGYDPVFFDVRAGKTGAEMTREEKNRVSHRGKAFGELLLLIQALARPA